jgi:Ras-related protein Rab-6A
MIKLILVGNSDVGKSSIISQYVNKEISDTHLSTITNEKLKKIVKIKDKELELDIWDTVGQENFRSVNKIFMKKAEIVLLVYDITNRKSFDELEFWYEQVIENCSDSIVVIAIAANKSDLYEEQNVDFDEGKEFAKKKSINIIEETSSLDFENIDSLFNKILLEYIDKKYSNDSIDNDNNNQNEINKDENKSFSLINSQSINENSNSCNKDPFCVNEY